MARLDSVTGKPRGFLRLGTHPRLDSVLFTIDLRDPAWHVSIFTNLFSTDLYEPLPVTW